MFSYICSQARSTLASGVKSRKEKLALLDVEEAHRGTDTRFSQGCPQWFLDKKNKIVNFQHLSNYKYSI